MVRSGRREQSLQAREYRNATNERGFSPGPLALLVPNVSKHNQPSRANAPKRMHNHTPKWSNRHEPGSVRPTFYVLQTFDNCGSEPRCNSVPNISLALQPKRESSLDQPQGVFERHIGRRREKQVQVVRHDDEYPQCKPTLFAIVLKNVDHPIGGSPTGTGDDGWP
jgi:hypothetical protein